MKLGSEVVARRSGGTTTSEKTTSVPRLTVTTLGRALFSVDGAPLQIASRKAKAVLAYLALSEHPSEARERLVGLFWSEVAEDNARASLRQVVHELRTAFRAADFDGFVADKQSIGLDPAQVSVDVRAIIAAADDGLPHPSMIEVSRLPETLLEGFDGLDPAFNAWLQTRRQTLSDRLLRGLEAGLRAATETQLIESLANALVHLDPSHEEACRGLIQARADRGDYGAALRLYKGLWDLLEEEYDVEPSEATQNLVVKIRNSMTAADQAAAFRAQPDPEVPGRADHAPAPIITLPTLQPSAKPSAPQRNMIITVGAFDASGTAPDQRYVVHGFRHELVASLVRFREWFVRDGVKGESDPPRSDDVASEYRVDATAISGPDSVRLILTLRDAQSAVYIWSDRYEITLAKWFDTQQAIIRRIAVALNVHLSANRVNRLANEPDVSLDVFDRWLRVQSMIHSLNPTDWPRAADILQRTIAEAPNFSPAYSSLAQLQNGAHIVNPGLFRNPDVERQSLDLARTAVRLDAVDARAQLCLGWANAMSRNYANAELHMGLAAELNENDHWTLFSTALFNAFVGDNERALAQCRRARDLAGTMTMTNWVYQSTIEFLRGDYDACIASSQHAGDVTPTNIAWRAAALAHLGRKADARATLGKFYDTTRKYWHAEDPSERNMLRWLLHLYPIREPPTWRRLRDGLAVAGAEVKGLEHGAW